MSTITQRSLLSLSLIIMIYSLNVQAQSAKPAGTVEVDPFGTAIRKSRWQKSNIPVCWENPTNADEKYRDMVKSAVGNTWEKYSSVKFEGWGKCAGDANGLRIKISDEAPHTESIGRFLDGRPNGMVLNFVFKKWAGVCRSNVAFCVNATATHEFGHALGFTHEQNRSDAPKRCQEKAQGSVGDFNLTKYDMHSIMNYCNPQWLGDGRLSPLDIQAVQKFYP